MNVEWRGIIRIVVVEVVGAGGVEGLLVDERMEVEHCDLILPMPGVVLERHRPILLLHRILVDAKEREDGGEVWKRGRDLWGGV